MNKTVDSYIENANPDSQPILHELRELVKKIIPEAQEGIWYNIPFYSYHGELVGFDAMKKHVSFGFGPDVLSHDMRNNLESKGYKLGKGTMQIKFNQSVPREEIEKIIKIKANKNEVYGGMKINLK